jgi:hypothetical protein
MRTFPGQNAGWRAPVPRSLAPGPSADQEPNDAGCAPPSRMISNVFECDQSLWGTSAETVVRASFEHHRLSWSLGSWSRQTSLTEPSLPSRTILSETIGWGPKSSIVTSS